MTQPTLLAFDIGNTTIALGLFRGAELVAEGKIAGEKVLDLGYAWRDIARTAGVSSADRVVVASVNPKVKGPLVLWALREFGRAPLVVGENLAAPIPVMVDNPSEVGADRVINALAAFRRYRRATIVVDMGTAITFDYVSDAGEYRGGVIAPGVRFSSRALSTGTALLPYVEVVEPDRVIGTNTVDCMTSGLFWGFVGMIDFVVEKMQAEIGRPVMVVATGGEAALIATRSRRIEEVVPHLTLEGLRIAAEAAR